AGPAACDALITALEYASNSSPSSSTGEPEGIAEKGNTESDSGTGKLFKRASHAIFQDSIRLMLERGIRSQAGQVLQRHWLSEGLVTSYRCFGCALVGFKVPNMLGVHLPKHHATLDGANRNQGQTDQ